MQWPFINQNLAPIPRASTTGRIAPLDGRDKATRSLIQRPKMPKEGHQCRYQLSLNQ
jgi:hypothetical protein